MKGCSRASLLSDVEFRRFIFKISLPIFFFILLKNGNELIRVIFGNGNPYSVVTLMSGFPLIIVYCSYLLKTVAGEPTK